MKISVDGQEYIDYNNEQNTKFNGWTHFDKPLMGVDSQGNAREIKGKVLEIKLDDGKHDPWGKKAWFGIRNLKITGRQSNVTTKRDLLRTFFNELTVDSIDSRLQIAICTYLDEKFFLK